MKKGFLKISLFALMLASVTVAFLGLNVAKTDASALNYNSCYTKVGGLDFTSESQITTEKDAERGIYTDKLAYWDYNGELLSIVNETSAKSGKAALVASATDFPRMSFKNLKVNVLYRVTYTIKMTDDTKWNSSFGISPYLNFNASNSEGEIEEDKGHDFHRNYADVVYEFSTTPKTTTFYFSSTVVGNKLKVCLYDTEANALINNEADAYKFKKDGYTLLDEMALAFYMQGGAKTMSYEIYDFEVSAYSAKAVKQVWGLDMSDPIVADATATDSSSNPGKVVVNGKDSYLSIVDDADVAGGKAIYVKDSKDYPRVRFSDSVMQTGKAYEVCYDLKMIDEEDFNTNWEMSPYLTVTAYSATAQGWNGGSGNVDFHCGYKYLRTSFTSTYFTVSFVLETKVVNNALVTYLYADMNDYNKGTVTTTINYPDGYNVLAAVDMALFKQGSTTEMGYNLANLKVNEIITKTVDISVANSFNREVTIIDPATDYIADASATDSGSNPGKIVVNGKSDYLTVSGKALNVKDSQDYPRIRFNTLQLGRAYKIAYEVKMLDQECWNTSWIVSPYIGVISYNAELKDWKDLGGVDFNCGYKDVQYAFTSKKITVSFFVDSVVNQDGGFVLNLYGDATAYMMGVPTYTFTSPAGYNELAVLDLALYTQGAAKTMPYQIASMGVYEKCTVDHVDANHDGKCDACGAEVTVEHVDANHDGKCDVCEAVVEVTHVDSNGDKVCDVCQADLSEKQPEGGNETPAKKGCGSTVGTSAILLMVTLGAACMFAKKRED